MKSFPFVLALAKNPEQRQEGLHGDWLRDTCQLHQDTWLARNEGGGTPTPYFLLYFSQHALHAYSKWVPPLLTIQLWSALSKERGSTFPFFDTVAMVTGVVGYPPPLTTQQ